MKKPITYALLLSATLVLAACDNKPEDKVESAKASLSDAADNLSSAASDATDALKEKTQEVMGHEPTVGDKVHDATDDAADALKDAGDKVLYSARISDNAAVSKS